MTTLPGTQTGAVTHQLPERGMSAQGVLDPVISALSVFLVAGETCDVWALVFDGAATVKSLIVLTLMGSNYLSLS